MSEIRLVVPSGAFGPSLSDSLLDVALRGIAVAASSDPKGEWAEKYGTDFENDEFMMHRYCWCEQIDCLWCSEDACGCEHPSPWYEWDGVTVTWDEMKAKLPPYQMPNDAAEYGTPAYRKATRAFNAAMAYRDAHLKQLWPARVHSCQPRGLMSDRRLGHTWLPPQSAPNFWHKPSGFKVWWYKYIGRSVEAHGTPPADLMARCIASIDGVAQ